MGTFLVGACGKLVALYILCCIVCVRCMSCRVPCVVTFLKSLCAWRSRVGCTHRAKTEQAMVAMVTRTTTKQTNTNGALFWNLWGPYIELSSNEWWGCCPRASRIGALETNQIIETHNNTRLHTPGPLDPTPQRDRPFPRDSNPTRKEHCCVELELLSGGFWVLHTTGVGVSRFSCDVAENGFEHI